MHRVLGASTMSLNVPLNVSALAELELSPQRPLNRPCYLKASDLCSRCFLYLYVHALSPIVNNKLFIHKTSVQTLSSSDQTFTMVPGITTALECSCFLGCSLPQLFLSSVAPIGGSWIFCNDFLLFLTLIFFNSFIVSAF